MVKTAYIFPGQGAQYVGMGKSLYDSFPEARKVFDEANQILGFDIRKLCFEGPLKELSQTVNSQPAILVHSIAALRVLENSAKNFTPSCTLGLSVGEYIALVVSGVVDYSEGLMLLRKRAIFMEEASRMNPGKMAAVIGLDVDNIDQVCQEVGAEVANLNCPGQVVISGTAAAIEKATSLAEEKGATKTVVLNVSGAFHSSLMEPAAGKLRKELENMEIKKPSIPMVCNVSPKLEYDPAVIRENVITQLTHKTLWEDSVKFVAESGINTFLEIGPGKVLKGLLRRIDRKLKVHNIDTAQDITSLLPSV